MRKRLASTTLASVLLLTAGACGKEYGEREVEGETDPPAVGGTYQDSITAGADIPHTMPLDSPTMNESGPPRDDSVQPR